MGWAVVCLELGFMLPMYGGKDEGAIKVHFMHLFVNRQSKNSLADFVLLTQIRNHGGTTGCNFDIFGLCLWNRFFLVQFNGWSYSFLRKFALINEDLLFCYISFKLRQSFFDNKEFLEKFASYHGPLFSSCR